MNEEKPVLNLSTVLNRQSEIAERTARIANSLESLLVDRLGYSRTSEKAALATAEEKQLVDALEIASAFQNVTDRDLSRVNSMLDYLYARLS